MELRASATPLSRLDGLSHLGVARFTFDTAAKDSSGVSNKTAAAHGTGVTLPIYACIVGGFLDVVTLFASATSLAQIAIMALAANDIQTATVITSAPFEAVDLEAITPKANTPESTGIKLTAAKEITVTVSVEALTAGKLTGFLYYVIGDVL